VLARPKPLHRRHSYAAGAFGLAALHEKLSLVLATKLFSVSLLGKEPDGDDSDA